MKKLLVIIAIFASSQLFAQSVTQMMGGKNVKPLPIKVEKPIQNDSITKLNDSLNKVRYTLDSIDAVKNAIKITENFETIETKIQRMDVQYRNDIFKLQKQTEDQSNKITEIRNKMNHCVGKWIGGVTLQLAGSSILYLYSQNITEKGLLYLGATATLVGTTFVVISIPILSNDQKE